MKKITLFLLLFLFFILMSCKTVAPPSIEDVDSYVTEFISQPQTIKFINYEEGKQITYRCMVEDNKYYEIQYTFKNNKWEVGVVKKISSLTYGG